MDSDTLFGSLDIDGDAALSRGDLHAAAGILRWHWPEAPLFAVLDHLTIRDPLPRAAFDTCLRQIARDSHGPFGDVLKRSPFHERPFPRISLDPAGRSLDNSPRPIECGVEARALPALLQRIASADIAERYAALLTALDEPTIELASREAGILIIDPQRSFTRGSWMQSMGPGGAEEVAPIRSAFANGGRLLGAIRGRVETLFTRCPFPPDSFNWDARVADLIDDSHLYFVKPGNSVLWPPTNGFVEWLRDLARRGKRTLVMGGCTLNSCVRVSSIDTRRVAAPLGLDLVVDLSICGARRGNYLPSPEFDGLSSVELSVRQLKTAGVRVTGQVSWT